MFLRVLTLAAIITSAVMPMEAAEQPIGDTGRRVVSTPTPTPHRKKKSRKKRSPSASPVRVKKKTASPSPGQKEEKSPSPSPSETASLPTPAASGAVAPTSTVSPPPGETPAAQTSVLPQKTGRGAPNVTLSREAITNFESYPPKVQKLLTSALELTTRNLDYKSGSADPANGGMDCSGFVYYVLNQNGVAPYVPDDSKDQYTWLRSAGTFEPVVSGKDDSFELNGLKPGDLLFWSGAYSSERDPPIIHVMIYLGREKKTGARVMVGASDGRTYQSQQRFGVSVFEFKMPQTENSEMYEGRERPRFIGYGHIPRLNE
jgi:cell wall-associated NlpC family hydrolase